MRFPSHPKHPERVCWGCERLCPANDLACGNGTDRTQHPAELFGDDWQQWSEDYMSETSSEARAADAEQPEATTHPHGPLYRLLAHDHERLDACLRAAAAHPDRIEMTAYNEFRAGLLRHIAIEEKIVIPTTRRLRGGNSLAFASQLRRDHAALASLLVPTPTHAILALIEVILSEHNPLEEGEGGLYAECERVAAHELDALLARAAALPELPLAPHVDGPRVERHVAELIAARTKR